MYNSRSSVRDKWGQDLYWEHHKVGKSWFKDRWENRVPIHEGDRSIVTDIPKTDKKPRQRLITSIKYGEVHHELKGFTLWYTN